MKGLGHEKEIKYFDKKKIALGIITMNCQWLSHKAYQSIRPKGYKNLHQGLIGNKDSERKCAEMF
jgi:hypothetical protein